MKTWLILGHLLSLPNLQCGFSASPQLSRVSSVRSSTKPSPLLSSNNPNNGNCGHQTNHHNCHLTPPCISNALNLEQHAIKADYVIRARVVKAIHHDPPNPSCYHLDVQFVFKATRYACSHLRKYPFTLHWYSCNNRPSCSPPRLKEGDTYIMMGELRTVERQEIATCDFYRRLCEITKVSEWDQIIGVALRANRSVFPYCMNC